MIGYLDIPSGLSGDMFLGCLVDAEWPVDNLIGAIRTMGLPRQEWSVTTHQVSKGALRATLVEVQAHEADAHRHLKDIRRLIESSDLPSPVKDRAVAVFVRLAEAEAKVHGTTPEQVHFHEVGSLDAIIDIVGAVCGLHELGVDTLHCGVPPLGDGWIDSSHGRMPLPAPATLELLAAVKAPTRPAPGPGEWLTPTGAALLAELARFEQPPMHLARVGVGAGQRDADWPNVARLWLGEGVTTGPMVQIETNIDDMNPQLYAAVSEQLFDAGARDVWLSPVQMKKGRPAVVLSALAPASCRQAVCELIIRETTTFGLRVHDVQRLEARREQKLVETPYGSLSVKLKWLDDELLGASPEYDQCRQLATKAGATVRSVYEAAQAAANRLVQANGARTGGAEPGN
jgi:hypothetical protein